MSNEPSNIEELIKQNELLQEQNILLREQAAIAGAFRNFDTGDFPKADSNSLEEILQRNELLKKQNALLREQNELLRESPNKSTGTEREIFIKDIEQDEMRDGFLVTSRRKKLWNVQIGLLQEFARICKKHDIRWYAIGGTLLGAARHKGFIPWDDDVDVILFRPDYEKFKSVVEDELRYSVNYSAWHWYNHRLESDNEAAQHATSDLPFISKRYAENYPGASPFFPMIRLVDNRTTCFFSEEHTSIFYAIWIDIFCLDPCPPFEDKTLLRNFNMAKELFFATILPGKVKEAVDNNEKFLVTRDKMQTFLNLPFKMRAQQYEFFSLKHFTETPYVSEMAYQTIRKRKRAYRSKGFDGVAYLPFETIEVPVPADYNSVLTDDFGDWHKIVVAKRHLSKYKVDVPYKEYFSKRGLKK